MDDIKRELALINHKISEVSTSKSGKNGRSFNSFILLKGDIIIDFHSSISDLLGYSRNELEGKSLDLIIDHALIKMISKDGAVGLLKNLSEPDKSTGHNILFRHKNSDFSEHFIQVTEMNDHYLIHVYNPVAEADLLWMEQIAVQGGISSDPSPYTTVLFRMSNEKNKYYYFSKQWLRFTGKKLKDELDEGWVNHIHPDDFDQVLNTISETCNKVSKYELSYRLIRFDGVPRWVYESGIPLFDFDGNFLGYLSVTVDVTRLREVEQKVQDSETAYKTLSENAPVLFKMADEHSFFYYFSKQWIEFSGRSLKEELGDNWIKNVYPDDQKILNESLENAFSKRKKFELIYRIRNHEGKFRWLLDTGIPLFSDLGVFSGFISASVDITEKKLDEEKKSRQIAFRDSEEKLQSSLDSSNLIALSIDRNRRITWCNRYFLELTGLDFQEVKGNEFSTYFGLNTGNERSILSSDTIFNMPAHASSFEAFTKGTFREKFIIKFSSIIFFGDIENPATITLVGENITEKSKVREALEKSNAQLKDFFDNANDLIQIFTPDGKFLFVNKIWKTKLGYLDEEIPKLRIRNIIHPDVLDSTLHQLSEIASGKTSPLINTAIISKSGQKIYLTGSVNCSFKDNIIKEYRAILYDITERIRAEKAQNLYYSIANLTIQSSDLDSLFKRIHEELDQIIQAKNFYIALYDKESNQIRFPYVVDENTRQNGPDINREITDTITEYAIHTQKSYFLLEADLLQMKAAGLVREEGKIPKVWLGVPLWLHDHIIGVISIRSYTENHAYTTRDLELLEFISGQIALSIERKQNEAKIREHTARQQAIFESTSHLIWSVDKNFQITSCNRNFLKFLEECIPYDPDGKVYPLKSSFSSLKYDDFWIGKYTSVFRGINVRFEARFLNTFTNTSEWKDIVLSPILHEDGKIEEVTGIAHDITEKKRSEIALRQSEEQFRDIYESFQDLYFRCDLRGNILMLSPSVTEILGYEQSELLGKNINNFYLYSKKTKNLLRQLVKRKNVKDFEASVIDKNGKILQCICNIRLVYDDSLNKVTMEGVTRDITHLKEANEELKQAKDLAVKSLKVKESFLANMSHEIRTPMNGIIGVIDLLESTTLNKEQKTYIHTIKKSSETLLTILNDILDLSKIEAGKMKLKKEPVRLKSVLDKLYALFAQQATSRNLKLVYHISDKLPEYVLIDETRLLQILSNLTSNAIKFTEGGGAITISLKKGKMKGKTNMIRCSVSDSGIGISPENAKKLFSSFSQLDTSSTKSYSGTGLGLAISKELSKLMGGKIGVYSTLGLGSTFWFTFEAIPSEKSVIVDNKLFMNDIQIEGYFDLEKPHILLVDDNIINRQIAGEILTKAGCLVDLAEDGRSSIHMVKKNKYDLIFMDIQMPEMDGVTATTKIKALNMNTPPVVAMTAYSMKEDRERFISQGLDDYIAKPIRAVELVNKVRQWIRDTQERIENGNKKYGAEIINLNVVRQLESLGGKDMIRQVFNEFIEEAEGQVHRCLEAIKTSTYADIMMDLHTLKGNAGTLGVEKLSSLAIEIETNLKKHQYDSIHEKINLLNLAYAEFLTEYNKLFNNE